MKSVAASNAAGQANAVTSALNTVIIALSTAIQDWLTSSNWLGFQATSLYV